MNWNQLIKGLRHTYLVASKFATQQAGMLTFIPGTYQREKNEGSRTIERIIIQQVSAMSEVYSIQKVVCKCYSPGEKIISYPANEEWVALYDFSTRQLLEIGRKKSIVFLPENSSLIIDNTYYTKIATSKCVEF